jgi:glycosyltransferase involved in cell wall biosynthesis
MTSQLRVAVANWTSRRVGGIEDYLSLLIPALHGAGFPTALWHEIDTPRDRQLISMPPGTFNFSAAEMGTRAALDALREWRPDVIYVHGLIDAQVEQELMGMGPSVFFLHAYRGTCISGSKTLTRPVAMPCDRAFGWPCLLHYFPQGCGGRSPVTMWQQYKRQSVQLEILRKYTSILTHSTHMSREMEKHGLQADVVPFPVEPISRSEVYAGDGTWRLLYASRMEYLKGGSFLLDALPHVAAAIKRKIHLTLAGDGPERGDLQARARAIETESLTTNFVGWIRQECVGALMQGADLLVVPSVLPEPLGSVGPAAAQHGLPAAAFDVGGIRTWLVDGVSGHLASGTPPTPQGLAAAIVRCLEDPDHYMKLRHGAADVARRFTMTQHLPTLIARLERAASVGAISGMSR